MPTKKIALVTLVGLLVVAIAVVAVKKSKRQLPPENQNEVAAVSEVSKALTETGSTVGSGLPATFPQALAAAQVPVESSEHIEQPRPGTVYTLTVNADVYTTRMVYTSALKRAGWSQFETKTPLGFDIKVATGTTEAVISIAQKATKAQSSSVQILLYE